MGPGIPQRLPYRPATPMALPGYVTGRMTEAEHLRQWLDGYVKTNCTMRTLDGYRSIIERHLIPANPAGLRHAFSRLARTAGLGGVRFHDLRHTFANLMLLRGAKPKVISEALGHASVAFTMDVYSHIIGGMQEDAMRLLDEIMPAGEVCKILSPICHQAPVV